jgi:hypothetical protein
MAHLSVRRGVVVPRTASWTPSSVWTAPAFCRPPSISASSKRADLVQRQPSQTPRFEIAHTPAALVHSGALERGGSTRVEHAVRGFQVARIDLRNDITAGQRLEQVSGGGLEPAVAWCHEQATCATGQVIVGEGLPIATRSHGLTRGDVPTVGTGFDLGVVASSPVRTESQPGAGDITSLHVPLKVLRPHVSGSR